MRLRAGLLNPVGLALLAAGCLLAAAMLLFPAVGPFPVRGPLVIAVALLAYVATVAVVAAPAPEPADPALRKLKRIRASMQAQLDGLRASEGSEGPSPLLPVLAEATRHMDRRLLPTLRQIAVRNAALTTQLERYRTAELPAPDARLLERLKAIHSTQIEAIAACVQQASNADATLLALIQQADEAGVAEEARLWATDLLDVADALTAVLSGIDPYEEALSLLRLGSGGSDRAGPLLDAAEGLEPPLGGAEGMALPSETRSAQPPQRPVSPGAVRSYADGLTAREAEVLRLLASGKTSKEIAEELVVTVPTVSRHVANIYGKIDARGRADATRYAFAHGLLKTGAEADRSDAGRHGPPKDGARS